MNGSTETTFYAGGYWLHRCHEDPPRSAGLAADFMGVLASCWAVHWLLS